MQFETVLHFLEGLIILALAAVVIVWLFGPEGYEVIQAAGREAAPANSVTVTNLVVPMSDFGPVTIVPRVNGGTWTYDITATPELAFTGTQTQDVDVVALLEFKDQSVLAKADFQGQLRDTFTIKPGDSQNSYTLKATVSTELCPIIDAEGNSFGGTLKEGQKVLLKDGKGKIIFYAMDISRHYSDLARIEFPDCKATFRVECEDNAGTMTLECAEENKNVCKGASIICGGNVAIQVADLKCSTRTVYTLATYGAGHEWRDAGEEVFVSFFAANECTKNRGSFADLMACADAKGKNFYMGRFRLSHPTLGQTCSQE